MTAKTTVADLKKFVEGVAVGTKVARINADPRLWLEVRRPGNEPARASWVLRYTHNGKKQSLGLGKYVVTGTGGVGLAEARKLAAVKLTDIDRGIQPVKAARATAKKQTEDSNAAFAFELRTVRKAAEQWHEATKGKLTSDKYREQRWRRLAEYLDLIGDTPVAALTVADVADTFTKLGAKDRAETFRRSSADLERVIEYAASQGWFDGVNPATRARKALDKPVVKHRRAFTVDRLPEFSKAMQEVDKALPYPVTAHLLRMLALTAARTREIRLMTWADVEGLDTDTATLHVPIDRMKRRKAWSIPLSTQAVQLLREIRTWQSAAGAGLKGVEDGFVFVRLEGNYKGRLCSENAVNDLLKAMGWHAEVTGHGLRKVMRTVGAKLWPYNGANRTEALEWALAHVNANKMIGIYDQNDHMQERRELLQWWADHLDQQRQPKASNVVPMRAAQGGT
jgi:integrase